MATTLMPLKTALVALALAAGALLGGCGGDGDGNGEPLSDDEAKIVVQMREEEKLARDVYRALAPHDSVFSTIADSEQNHMDAVGNLLDRHDLADPAAGRAAGSFQNQDIQALHDQLVASGNHSQKDALAVGVEIEELDLHDLDTGLGKVTGQDVRNVFGNLSRGSRNHLRAFYSRLQQAGGSYTPKHLDAASFQAIVTSPTETGG